LPIHASWLNQIEIAFSIIQRTLLQPNQYDSIAQLARALNASSDSTTRSPSPSTGTSTSSELAELLAQLATHEPTLAPAA